MAKTKIGLALGGGAARGWAHIGVVRALAERFGISEQSVSNFVKQKRETGSLEPRPRTVEVPSRAFKAKTPNGWKTRSPSTLTRRSANWPS